METLIILSTYLAVFPFAVPETTTDGKFVKDVNYIWIIMTGKIG